SVVVLTLLCSILAVLALFVYRYWDQTTLPSFPTRRSSDLTNPQFEERGEQPYVAIRTNVSMQEIAGAIPPLIPKVYQWLGRNGQDRKSTRLNSSHVKNSYAVFGLRKKRSKIARKSCG